MRSFSLCLGSLMIAVLSSCESPGQVSSNSAGKAAATSVDAQGRPGPKKLALLVGIDHYKYPSVVSSLDGAVNDIEAMQAILTSPRYGFAPQNIHVLKDGQATRENILKKEIDGFLIAQAEAGAIVVLHYSGHGSRMQNRKDPSGFDNTVVPYDSRDSANLITDIRDKELNARLRRLSEKVGPRGGVTFILDSCHSGTGARGSGKVRRAPDDTRFGLDPPEPDLAGQPPTRRDITSVAFSDRDVNYVLIAGSRTDQLSYERQGLETHGALTFYLLRELEKPSSKRRTYRDVMSAVIPAVSSEFPAQIPQLEGKNIDTVVFGDERVAIQPYILSKPAQNGLVELQGGRVLGMTEGSEFDVYSDKDRLLAPPERPIARIRLTQIDAFRAFGKLLSGQQVAVGSKAIERIHSFEAKRTRLVYEQLAQSKTLRDLKGRIDSQGGSIFSRVEKGPYDIRLEESEGYVHMFGPDGVELSTRLSVASPNVVDSLERRLRSWARWFGLRTLTNPVSNLDITFALRRKGDTVPLAPGQVPAFSPGEKRFDLMVENVSDKKLFLYVLDLTSAGGVTQEYPDLGSHVPLDPGQKTTIPDWGVGLPSGADSVRDVHKLIASTRQIDLQFLQMATPKSASESEAILAKGPPDPLQRLLLETSSGARNSSRPAPSDDWITREVTFDVCKEIKPSGTCK